jgi:ActR/RegA family two-component response regulator
MGCSCQGDNDAVSVLLPAGAAAARLIVCERSTRWAAALRRELAARAVRVYETRSLGDCWKVLSEAPASIIVVELSAGSVAGLWRQMVTLERDFPLARVAVVADRSLAGHEWLMREAGAVHFLCSPRQCGLLAQLAARHLAQAPPPPRSLTERVWASLPWAQQT